MSKVSFARKNFHRALTTGCQENHVAIKKSFVASQEGWVEYHRKKLGQCIFHTPYTHSKNYGLKLHLKRAELLKIRFLFKEERIV